jgi:hypothetical protein
VVALVSPILEAGESHPRPQVSQFTPLGTIKRICQASAVFSETIVSFGDRRSPIDPFIIDCPEDGVGRWVDSRTWMYNFAHDLPGGVRCGFKLRPGLATQAGTLVTGQTIFTFTTGGPSILTAIPIQDSTDEGFRRLVSVRTALAGSLNIPAVRTLGLIAAEDFVQQLRRLGLDGANESGDYYRPSLALGSIDASLWELLHAYRTLANGGLWTPLRLTPGEAAIQGGRRVYSEATTFLLSHILSDRCSRSVAFGLESPLATRF